MRAPFVSRASFLAHLRSNRSNQVSMLRRQRAEGMSSKGVEGARKWR